MQLYNTKVIPSGEDYLWEISQNVPGLADAKLLVVSAPYAADGNEARTLAKMMAACKLSPSEFVVIRLEPSQKISWQLLAAAGAPKCILMLDVAPTQLVINALFRLNHCNSFLGCTFIPSYSLSQIEQNAALKRALWEQGLKPCFDL